MPVVYFFEQNFTLEMFVNCLPKINLYSVHIKLSPNPELTIIFKNTLDNISDGLLFESVIIRE